MNFETRLASLGVSVAGIWLLSGSDWSSLEQTLGLNSGSLGDGNALACTSTPTVESVAEIPQQMANEPPETYMARLFDHLKEVRANINHNEEYLLRYEAGLSDGGLTGAEQVYLQKVEALLGRYDVLESDMFKLQDAYWSMAPEDFETQSRALTERAKQLDVEYDDLKKELDDAGVRRQFHGGNRCLNPMKVMPDGRIVPEQP